jgi:protein subunit release factor B
MKMNFGVTRKKQEELEARMSALGVREADIKEKYVRSSGPGGQNVDKTASCVYLKHVRSGLEVKMQRERSQGLNRYYARKRLCELVEQEKLGSKSPAALKAEKIRKQKTAAQTPKQESRQNRLTIYYLPFIILWWLNKKGTWRGDAKGIREWMLCDYI